MNRSKLEYMLEVAFELGRMTDYDFSIDIEDFLLLCSVIVDDFFNDEYPYIKEFLENNLTKRYVVSKMNDLGFTSY